MERHKFTSLARHLSDIESQLTSLATSVGALHIAVKNLLSGNREVVDMAVGHDAYQTEVARTMAIDLFKIEGAEA